MGTVPEKCPIHNVTWAGIHVNQLNVRSEIDPTIHNGHHHHPCQHMNEMKCIQYNYTENFKKGTVPEKCNIKPQNNFFSHGFKPN